MQQMLELIRREREAYERHPFILYLRDASIPAEQRLAYAPFAAHFVMTFADINRFMFRDPDSSDPYQAMVNRHSDEDAVHWRWFLNDLEVLGWNPQMSFTDALRFLWREEGRHTREIGYWMAFYAMQPSPLLRLVIIEISEAMGNVWLSASLAATRDSEQYRKLVYFADHHMQRETGHAIGSDSAELTRIVLPPEVRATGEEAARVLFQKMSEFNSEILAHARESGSDPTRQIKTLRRA